MGLGLIGGLAATFLRHEADDTTATAVAIKAQAPDVHESQPRAVRRAPVPRSGEAPEFELDLQRSAVEQLRDIRTAVLRSPNEVDEGAVLASSDDIEDLIASVRQDAAQMAALAAVVRKGLCQAESGEREKLLLSYVAKRNRDLASVDSLACVLRSGRENILLWTAMDAWMQSEFETDHPVWAKLAERATDLRTLSRLRAGKRGGWLPAKLAELEAERIEPTFVDLNDGAHNLPAGSQFVKEGDADEQEEP